MSRHIQDCKLYWYELSGLLAYSAYRPELCLETDSNSKRTSLKICRADVFEQ